MQNPEAQKPFLSLTLAALAVVFACTSAAAPARPAPAKNIAAIVTVYYHNSHADLILSRLLQTDRSVR